MVLKSYIILIFPDIRLSILYRLQVTTKAYLCLPYRALSPFILSTSKLHVSPDGIEAFSKLSLQKGYRMRI